MKFIDKLIHYMYLESIFFAYKKYHYKINIEPFQNIVLQFVIIFIHILKIEQRFSVFYVLLFALLHDFFFFIKT